jgi:hypothetical protein
LQFYETEIPSLERYLYIEHTCFLTETSKKHIFYTTIDCAAKVNENKKFENGSYEIYQGPVLTKK